MCIGWGKQGVKVGGRGGGGGGLVASKPDPKTFVHLFLIFKLTCDLLNIRKQTMNNF